MKPILLLGAMALFMSACQSTDAPKSDTPMAAKAAETTVSTYTRIRFAGLKATPAERLQCEAVDGKIHRAGLLGAEHCIQDLPDAGKVCRDSDECLNDCVAAGDGAFGQEGTGQCRATDNVFGCVAHVEDGRIEPVLCAE